MQLFLPLHPEYVGVLSDFCSSYPLLYHIIILRLLISRTSIVYFKSLTTWSVLSLANYILGLKFAIICLASHMYISSVQSFSRVRLFATPWITARQATLSITNSWSSLRLLSIESVMPFSHLILCRPLLLLPPNPPSIRVFPNESTLHMRWPKDWSFSFSVIPSKEIPGLISFRMDWLDLLAVQGTLKSLLQHHTSKASILQHSHSAFLTVQLSHPYMTTGKTIALTRRTFVGKVMYLLLNRLSRLVVTFLPRSFLKCSICTFKNVYPLTRYRFYMYLLTRHIHKMFKYSFYFLIFIYLIYHLKKQVK